MQLCKQCFSVLSDIRSVCLKEIWRLPFCSGVWLHVSDRTFSLLLSKHCQQRRCWTRPSTETMKCVHTWVYFFICVCVSECIVFVSQTEENRNSCYCQQWACVCGIWFLSFILMLFSVLCRPFTCLFMSTVAAEERRRLCKCLLYESLVKMWLQSDKHKTSGHRPNICCLEGGGWSEQGHGRNTDGKGREERREEMWEQRAGACKNELMRIPW